MNPRRLIILTGISGAGKSQALKSFEDFGFYCVDNLPIALIDRFADLLLESRQAKNVALGIDIREGEFLRGFSESLKRLRQKGLRVQVIFMDADDQAVIQRYSETRHRHPLGINILDAVKEERRLLAEIKAEADRVFDTSDMTLGELKEALSAMLELKRTQEMTLSVVSFGYKYGLPLDADLVMDVRFLPNPNYVKGMRSRCGLDRPVRAHLLRQPVTRVFLSDYLRLVKSLLPYYIREGKSYLTIAVGCTGGRHRSVFFTHQLASELQKSGYRAREFHRDINR
ncbi:MAG: RNase adapter RapZ [Elusimicrobia bacterium]|nr:RNase adapter RapZ [Elusimicrobiota bacterium]